MIIRLQPTLPPDGRRRLVEALRAIGVETEPVVRDGEDALRVTAPRSGVDRATIEAYPGVAGFVALRDAPVRGGRVDGTSAKVEIGGHVVGDGGFTLIAGPCAVEDEPTLLAAARSAKEAGAQILRGGAFKPRTSPYSFQGLGEAGLRLLERARDAYRIPFVTEALDVDSFERVEAVADAVQIGARSMQNTSLLKRCGRSRRPILLKRGLSATLEELLLAAEYVLDAGNERVVLCERGIRAFPGHARFTLDLSIVPAVRRHSRLPILVDPSHATGDAGFVPSMARAAAAAGADGVLLEIHPDPSRARCDGGQALSGEALAELAPTLRAIRAALRGAEAAP